MKTLCLHEINMNVIAFKLWAKDQIAEIGKLINASSG